MQYAWDAAKSTINFRERGFDFAFATLAFAGPVLVREDRRRDYGERRFIAIGLAERLHLTGVLTDRVRSDGEIVRRIIRHGVAADRKGALHAPGAGAHGARMDGAEFSARA